MSKPDKIAGYVFQKTSLLDEALTHPSLAGAKNYQRFEFLGDRVLALVISTWLLELYPSENEGKLNRRFAALVRKETLAQMAKDLDLVRLIKLTPGAEQEGTRDKEAVQADICEAVIGAIYLDGGYETADTFIRKHWRELINIGPTSFVDSKTQLQEWCQARALPLPKYHVVDRTGPDHDPLFTIEVRVEGKGSQKAVGPAKRYAEQSAAALLFQEFNKGKSRDRS